MICSQAVEFVKINTNAARVHANVHTQHNVSHTSMHKVCSTHVCLVLTVNTYRRRVDYAHMHTLTRHTNTNKTQIRAVANGPVGPVLAGPIIEPVVIFFNCRNDTVTFWRVQQCYCLTAGQFSTDR